MRADISPAGSYGAGDWVAIASPRVWLLIDAQPHDPVVDEVWRTLHDPASSPSAVDGFVESKLATGGVAFGLVSQGSDSVVIVLGGAATAEIVTKTGSERVSCPGAASRVEFRLREIPGAVQIDGSNRSVPAVLPLAEGVAPAGSLRLDWNRAPVPSVKSASGEVVSTTFDAVLVDQDPQVGSSVENQQASVGNPIEMTAAAGATLSSAPEIEQPNAPIAATPATTSTGVEVERSDDLTSAARVVTSGAPEAESNYDFLFGHTIMRSVETAAVHLAADEQAEERPAPVMRKEDSTFEPPVSADRDGVSGSPHSQSPPTSTARETTPAPAAAPALPANPPIVRAETSGMIDAVPWATAEESLVEPPATPGAATEDGEVVDLTISRAALARQLASQTSTQALGPTVHAVHCPASHPNPAHADVCRVCRTAIDQQTPITVPRPVLGVLRFSTGDVIALDRGVLIGRKPDQHRMIDGDRPHVVKLPSPENDISRNHLEIHLDDWHVLVTDLNSVNGTMVVRPGQEPERLRPDQATLIEPGTVVSLADDVTFEFQAVG